MTSYLVSELAADGCRGLHDTLRGFSRCHCRQGDLDVGGHRGVHRMAQTFYLGITSTGAHRSC